MSTAEQSDLGAASEPARASRNGAPRLPVVARPAPRRPAPEPGLIGRVTRGVTGRVVDTIQPDVILEHVDVDAVLERVDVDAVLDRVDVNALLDRIDVDALMDRVDVDALLDRIDVQRLIGRADLQSIIAGLDLNAVLSDVDLETLVRRSGVPDIVAESTGRMAGSALDVARRQVVGVDALVERVVDKLMRRRRDRVSSAPEKLRSQDGDRSVTGHYAGAVSRGLAVLVDGALIMGVYTLTLAGLQLLVDAFFQTPPSPAHANLLAAIALGSWAFAYSFVSLAVTGRTVGRGLLGLRVVQADGDTLSARAAFVRTLVWPLSLLLFGFGFLLVLIRADHRALHDLIARTAEVYDWGERSAHLPAPLDEFLAKRAG